MTHKNARIIQTEKQKFKIEINGHNVPYTVTADKKAYSILCINLTHLNIFSKLFARIILTLHFTKIYMPIY